MSAAADSYRPLSSARVLLAVASGLAVLMSGYVALLLFWTVGAKPAGLPGLFHYPDATWGDGLLLPVLALCLQLLIGRLTKTSRRWPTWIATAAGATAGALLIFTWWADPRPSPNWTLLAPHDFTLPGQWHAAFLIATSAFFAGSWVELFRRIRAAGEATAAQVLASPVTAGAVACTAGYAWLAAADSSRAAHTASGQGSLIALAASAAALIACLKWAAGGSLTDVARSVIAGLLLAAAFVIFVNTYSRTGSFMLIVALIGALGAGVALAGAPGHEDHSFNLEMIAVPALFGALVLLAAHTTRLVIVILAPVAAIIFSCGLRHLYSNSDQPRQSWLSVNYLASSGISACLLASGTFGLWLSADKANAYITAAFLLTIIGAVLGGVFLPFYRTDYIKLMQIEGDPEMRQPDGRPSAGQHRAAVDAWLRLGGYAISATASMLVLTVALAPSLGWKTGTAQVVWRYPLGIAVIGLVLAMSAAGALFQSGKRHPDNGLPYTPRGGRKYAWMSFAGGAVVSILGTIWLLRNGEFNILALVQSAFLTAFVALSMIDNGALLHTRRVDPQAKLTIVINCFAVFIGVYWSLTNVVRSQGSASKVGPSFAAFMIAVLLVAVLMEAGGCATYVAGGKPYRTDYPPVWGLAQDCFLMICMWFVLGWTPQTILAHVPPGTPERWSAIGTILAGFLLLFGPAFLWILENNDTHVERQRHLREVEDSGVLAGLAAATSSADRIRTLPRRIDGLRRSIQESRKNPDPELTQYEFIVRLSGHTAVQNSIALILAVITIVGIIGVSSGLAPNAVGVTGLLGDRGP